MGFFSWLTGDDQTPIMNKYTPKPSKVAVLWPCGEKWIAEYDGYGRFNGKNIYVEIGKRNNIFNSPELEAKILEVVRGSDSEYFCSGKAMNAMTVAGGNAAIINFEPLHKAGWVVPKFASNLEATYEEVGFSDNAVGQGYFSNE